MAPRRRSFLRASTLHIIAEPTKVDDDIQRNGSKIGGDYSFFLANPKDLEIHTKSVIQEVLALYMKELPGMHYAANTGKESMFLERCVTNGKYCTLLIKRSDDKFPGVGEIIAAITYQIIPADTQYAEIPLAAVNSIFQKKGIGHLLYLELKERLQSVGIRNVLCWGDKESEGFWHKQGFTMIGEVNKKGRALRLPIKADVRRALCFPGCSTLMMSHISKDCTTKFARLPMLSLAINSPDLVADSQEPCMEMNQISAFPDVGLCPVAKYCNVADTSGTGVMERSEADSEKCSCSMQIAKKRSWEISSTSMKSKKVKGTDSNDCSMGSQHPSHPMDGKIVPSFDAKCKQMSAHKSLSNTSLKNPGGDYTYKKIDECPSHISNEDHSSSLDPSAAKCVKIMLMNIADDDKRSSLTKIIEDLGGVVTSHGSESTHIVTGKIRRTLNFCIALCSGCWVISPTWLKESYRKGRFVDEMPFILNDGEYMSTYRCDIKCTIMKAKANPNSLLKGLSIWPASHVQPPSSTISAIVNSAGGNVIKKSGEIIDASKTIFIACDEDVEEAITAVKMGISTFSIDWLMNCIMTQELDFEAPKFTESL